MKVKHEFFFYALVAVGALAFYHLPLKADMPAPEKPVVLELFTSQSCSSCPAADKVLEKLSEQDNIIALSCNVTYWNHLSWKDTLSQEFCTDRQRAYSIAQQRGGRIFTPEIMVNGHDSVVGSNWNSVVGAVNKAKTELVALDLKKDEKGLSVILPPEQGINPVNTVLLLSYREKYTQSIPSGENRGRTVDYTNPITAIEVIEENWLGDPLMIAKTSHEGVSGYAVIVHEGSASAPVIAAGRLHF